MPVPVAGNEKVVVVAVVDLLAKVVQGPVLVGPDSNVYKKVPVPFTTFATIDTDAFWQTGPPPEIETEGSGTIENLLTGVVAVLPQASVTTAV